MTLYEGSYSFYAERRAASASTNPNAPASAKAKDTRAKPVGPRKMTFKERAELAGIEDAIAAAESAVKAQEATLSDPVVFRDRATEVPALIAALDAARAEVERLFARWQELEALAATT